ncbi:4'-phosphopantetheinyl transferase superfamily protein (plasmid) [Paraburkholderia ginsengisoli]|uniref:4'-phosphopantetheinyl transferase superfamily protein n=2 Tax=Paraburkholderia ginsengisoli TaxID=311231 RepID=A0A7T4TCK4_9BURK|nr:4'-phosphopantetheinyl transferase superfamily protein [Paraburkholderia ginsengisoli]
MADRLAAGEVHVWRAHLGAAVGRVRRGTLFRNELERANRLRRPDHREAFVFARDMLRTVLGGYLRADSAQLVFEMAAHGKPVLAGQSIEFNLGRCGGAVLLAIASGRPVGIDLESCERDIDIETLADACLTRNERHVFDALAIPLRKAWVLQLWTRKEALLKAQGSGLCRDPRELDVPWPATHSGARYLHEQDRRWMLADIPLGIGWRAAVAVEAEAENIHGFCLGW